MPGHIPSTSSQAVIILGRSGAHVKGFVEAVQSASNGLGLISHSSCFFLNKAQRNTLILGWRGGVEAKGCSSPTGGALPEAAGKAGRGERSRAVDPLRPLWGRLALDEPSPAGKPRPLGTGRPRQLPSRRPSLPRLRGCRRAGAGSAPRLLSSPPPRHPLPCPSCFRPA